MASTTFYTLKIDSKLQWGSQVERALTLASKALNAIRLIQNYFNQNELIQLVSSNFYSVLYYNSKVWNLHTLKQSLKNSLLSASSKALILYLRNHFASKVDEQSFHSFISHQIHFTCFQDLFKFAETVRQAIPNKK